MSGALYRTVSPRRITAPALLRCSLTARIVYLHLLVGEVATNLPGLVRAGVFTLADETGLAPDVVRDALGELATPLTARPPGLGVEVDEEARLIRIPGVAADHARSAENPKTVTGWINSLASLPASPLVTRHAVELNAVCPEKFAALWSPLGDRLRFDRQSLPERTKDQDQDQDLFTPPYPPPGGTEPEVDDVDRALAEVLDALAAERSQLTGVEGKAAPPSPKERARWSSFWATRPASLAEILRAVRRAAEALRRRGKADGLTLVHLLRNWERLRDAHELDVPATARAPPPTRPLRALLPRNPDPFAD